MFSGGQLAFHSQWLEISSNNTGSFSYFFKILIITHQVLSNYFWGRLLMNVITGCFSLMDPD